MTNVAEQKREEKKRKDQSRKKAERKHFGGKPGFSTDRCGKLCWKPFVSVENSEFGTITDVRMRRKRESGLPSYYHWVFTCPYYGWDSKCSVHCEGGNMQFPDAEAAKEYLLTYCTAVPGWRRCTVAQAITRHYEKKYEELEMLPNFTGHIP